MPDRSRLSEKQHMAIDLILQGLTDREVAQRVGVTRQTVNEWRNHNARFIAELNRRRKMIHEAALNRLIGLALKALETVEKELEGGNWKLAVQVLKMSGLDFSRGLKIGSVSESEIELEKISKGVI